VRRRSGLSRWQRRHQVCLEVDPGNYEALFNRGYLKVTLDDTEGALSDLNKAYRYGVMTPNSSSAGRCTGKKGIMMLLSGTLPCV